MVPVNQRHYEYSQSGSLHLYCHTQVLQRKDILYNSFEKEYSGLSKLKSIIIATMIPKNDRKAESL